MADTELCWKPATELVALIRSRELSPVELMDAVLIGRVECRFSRWQGKDQPAMTGIHGFESKNVAKKQSIRLGVFGVHNHMSGRNHFRPSITSRSVSEFYDALPATVPCSFSA